MPDWLKILNPYIRRARLEPALLVFLPIALSVLAWSPSGIKGFRTVWSVFVLCGGTALLSQVARDSGKRKESALFGAWGGKPTTRLLRHRDSTNAVLLERRHKVLQAKVSSVAIPTKDQEQANPNAADEVYDACTAYLLEKTRDQKKYALIFEENCNYGFRRNLWGMKPIGLAVSLLSIAAVAPKLYLSHLTGSDVDLLPFICEAVNVVLALGWFVWFTPDWVRLAADAYAERLLAACETV